MPEPRRHEEHVALLQHALPAGEKVEAGVLGEIRLVDVDVREVIAPARAARVEQDRGGGRVERPLLLAISHDEEEGRGAGMDGSLAPGRADEAVVADAEKSTAHLPEPGAV